MRSTWRRPSLSRAPLHSNAPRTPLQRRAGVSPQLDALCRVSLFALRPAWLKRATVKLEEIRPMRFLLLSAALIVASAGAAIAQDPASGEKVFAQCRACHQTGENAKNAV